MVAVALALAARWSWGARGEGPAFRPQPDALEYAASAQALVQTGRFFLQVGPLEEPPHYSPGWPAVLAVALECGTPPQRLWLLPGLCGGLLCLVLGCGTALLVIQAAPPPRTTARWWAGLVAGWAAACAWAVAPPAVEAGSALLNDEPTALLATAALCLVFLGLERDKPVPWLAAAGLAGGLTAAMRPVEGALLAVPALVLVVGAARRLGSGRRRRAYGALALGALVPCMLVGLLLVHSGRPAWQWTDYGFWNPAGRLTLEPRLAGLLSQARPLLGLPWSGWSLGGWWPLLGWLAGGWILVRRRRGTAGAPAGCTAQARFLPYPVRVLTAALLLWVLARLAVFGSYYYSASRFYLAAAAALLFLAAGGCGLYAVAVPRRAWIAGVALVGVLASLGTAFVRFRATLVPGAPPERIFRRFSGWMELTDEERARQPVPFDPLLAQAVGLLDPETLQDIHGWGPLPPTLHVLRLRRKGLLP